jgi:hypothetical protein
MENQSDRPERRLENNAKALEALQRAHADQVAHARLQIEARHESEARMRPRAESAHQESEKLQPIERVDLKKPRTGDHSADEVAGLRTSRLSEMRREATALWEPIHRRNYREFADGIAKDKLQKSEHLESRIVWPEQIAPLGVTAPELDIQSEKFWHHHDNTPDYYRRMGESYPKLHEQVRNGRTIKELTSDPEFKDSARFWFGEPALKLDHYKDSYFCDESGHHRVALAQRYQLGEIQVQVREWNQK